MRGKRRGEKNLGSKIYKNRGNDSKLFPLNLRERRFFERKENLSSFFSFFFFNKITSVKSHTVPYRSRKEKKRRERRERKRTGQIGGKKDGINFHPAGEGETSPTERKNKRSVALATGLKRDRSISPLRGSVAADTSSPKRGNKLE